ncbi:hypothetical protein [Streptomyces sp. UG1]|uniref:hypothetical protein n=1 Tax=Streptomyces sp. UG1 TaxID=3417652 RepID=UPI003CF56EA7
MKRPQPAWPPVLVNLLIGIPAMVPLHSLWWLTQRSWFGHESVVGRSSTIIEVCGADCDRVGVATLTVTVVGMLVLLLVIVADVLVPLHRDRPLAPWLTTMSLVLVPYVLFQAVSSAL